MKNKIKQPLEEIVNEEISKDDIEETFEDGEIITSTVPGAFKIDREKYFNLPGIREALEIMKKSSFFPKANFE